MAKFVIINPWSKDHKKGDIFEAATLHPSLRNHVAEVKEVAEPVPADVVTADDAPVLELAIETDGVDTSEQVTQDYSGLTVAQIRDVLDSKGIEYQVADKKADLIKLLA